LGGGAARRRARGRGERPADGRAASLAEDCRAARRAGRAAQGGDRTPMIRGRMRTGGRQHDRDPRSTRPRPELRVGILGGGQLARMTAEAAERLGVEVVVLDPEPGSPAGQVARQIVAGWTDTEALAQLAREVDVVTLENEFVDLGALDA